MDFDLPGADTRPQAEAGVDLALFDARGEPLLSRDGKRVTLKLLGTDSKTYRTRQRAQFRRRLAEQAQNKGAADDSVDDGLELIVACTVGWDNLLDKAGKPVAFSADAARKLYESFPVIYDQADMFIANRANFLPASSVN